MARPSAAPLPDRIETPRLVLRGFRVDDVRHFVPHLGAWEVARWLANVPHPYTPAHGREWVEAAEAYRAERRALCLLAEAGGMPVGSIEINLERNEIGYWVGIPHQGQGYASEMVAAMLHAGFATLGLPLLKAATDADNDRSRRVLEKAGFRYKGLHDYDFALRGGVRPGHHYELTAADWRAARPEVP